MLEDNESNFYSVNGIQFVLAGIQPIIRPLYHFYRVDVMIVVIQHEIQVAISTVM